MEKNDEKKVKRRASRRSTFLLINIIVMAMVFYLGYYQAESKYKTQNNPGNVDLKLFWEAWNKFKEKSVDSVSDQKMIDGAISGMLSSLKDPYTVYLTKEDNARFREDIQGEFGGIGIEIVEKDKVPTVVTPLSGSPAEKAGLKAGDIISQVDGTKTSDMTFDEAINKIRGAKGTKVTLKVLRSGAPDEMTFEVTRDTIVVKSVEWRTEQKDGKKIGYIKIKQFGDDTDALMAEAAADMKKENPDGIVLDLRNDPGGYLDSAVNVASTFIKDGTIVTEKGRNNSSKDYKATGADTLNGFKVVVLANEGSASASEIVTGALKDRLKSKVVGEKTFGKGSVQELIDLSDGSAAKITVAKWFTPSGSQINGEGIKPDVEVADDEKTPADEQLIKAEEVLLAQ